MSLNPAIAHLAPLIGTWRGDAHGQYPTISDFDYTDEQQFLDIGKPFLLFVQRTWIGDEPRHTETGYLRAPRPDTVEFVVAIPTGQAEIGVGPCTVDGGVLTLDTDATGVQNTPTAKQVTRIVRHYRLEGDRLHHEMHMAAVGQDLTLHLTSRLTRVASR